MYLIKNGVTVKLLEDRATLKGFDSQLEYLCGEVVTASHENVLAADESGMEVSQNPSFVIESGDFVLFSPYMYKEVHFRGETFYVVDESDIYAVVKQDE